MAWSLDNPWVVDVLDNAPDIQPAFDGRYLWVPQNDCSVVVLDFWGPYPELDNDEFTRRHLHEDYDYSAAGAQGPAFRKVGTLIPTPPSGLTAAAPEAIKYYNGAIYYLLRNTNGSHFIAKTAVTKVNPGVVSVFSSDSVVRRGTSFGFTDIAYSNGRVYWVSSPPTSQTGTDSQLLWYAPANSSLNSEAAYQTLPLRKQFEKRYLAVANDCLYISAFNEMSVLKFNAVTGTYIGEIPVNRDIERLFAVGNDVYVVSSLKAESDLGEELGSFPTSMVSKIDDTDTVTPMYGVIHGSDTGNPVTFALDASHAWFTSANGGYQRTKTSDKKTLISDDTILQTPDMLLSKDFKGFEVVGDAVEFTTDQIGKVLNVTITPEQHYEWFNGTTFEEITVPRYLFLICVDKVIATALRDALKYENEFQINQYAAVSTGAKSYKGD